MEKKIKIAIVFGSRSVEHEVSIVTAMQVFENIDREKYDVVPVYIDKQGKWLIDDKLSKLENFSAEGGPAFGWRNSPKDIKAPEYFFEASPSVKTLTPRSALKFFKKIKADIYFPVIHGTYGEDGTIQGMFEMANVPYVGSGVTGSAVGMDKIIQKAVFKEAGLPIVKYVWFSKSEWQNNKVKIIEKIEKNLGYPVFVKPANLGSSIAINKAVGLKELELAIEVASNFDQRIIIEEGKEGIIEINCSVIGNYELNVSVCEQPIKGGQMLSYEDKYLKGGKNSGLPALPGRQAGGRQGMAGLSRLVPAPISEELTIKIQEMAKMAFKAIDASGVSRVDFLVDEKDNNIWINEINTLPGSLSFYLWEKSGINFSELIDRLASLGFERYKEQQELTYSYDSDLISKTSSGTKS